MMSLQVHQSNRMEALAAGLAELMRADPGDPLAPERIVVPHPTIGRWLSLELARELGIAANIRFELPAEFAWSIMRCVVPGLSREQPYEPSRLRWRIHDLLPGAAEQSQRGGAGDGLRNGNLPPSGAGDATRALEGVVGGYLRDGDRRKRLELADRLARMYDQCLLYRPDWIRAWENEPAPHWQGRLWRHLVDADGSGGVRHWVGALEQFRRMVGRGSGTSPGVEPSCPEPPRPDWPRRASFFAVPALSPSYLEMLIEAARGIEIHLYVLNPCREYWGDICSRREMNRRSGDADPDASYFTEGNELLAACGRAGRDMIDALVEATTTEWDDYFVTPAGERRLAAVQRDVLHLRLAEDAARDDASRAATGGSGRSFTEAPPGANGPSIPQPASASLGKDEEGDPPAPDASIQIHVCHSPVREAEVLHDRLLALFDAYRDLQPADVLVLTPDLEVYGPAVEAVFAAAERIPCSVARTQATSSRTMRAFLDILALARSRYGAEEVLGPLAAPAVRVRFGIGEAELPAIRGVVREAGIRWGVDETHRAGEGLPETAEHTWRQGLRRLLLGYAMADANAPVAGLVPCLSAGTGFGKAEVDGECLGRFVSYCEAVFGLRERLGGERSPAQWERLLQELVEEFLSDGAEAAGDWSLAGELADEAAAVRALVLEFGREAAHAEAPVPLAVVLDALQERARATGRRSARIADGVTVAALAPGGIYPAEVVCLAGMNDGVFPRSPSTPSFDVLATGPARRGDRDVRYEDRYAFIEALLAARRCFVVTYSGRGLRDDAPIPPSLLVDELKDYLRRRFPGTEFGVLHPLQPFSPRNFISRATQAPAGAAGTFPDEGTEDANLVSYSAGMCEAAWVMRGGTDGRAVSNRFTRTALPEPDESLRRVDLAELAAFFANPTRSLLRDRLRVRLELENLALDVDEPFVLDNLERYHLRSEIWDQIQEGVESERSAALLHGSGRLPQAGPGRIVHQQARADVEPLRELLEPWWARLDAAPRGVDFELDGFRVTGALRNVYGVSPVDANGGAPTAAGADDVERATAASDGMIWWRIGALRARDRIEIWLRQLAWAAAGHGSLKAEVIRFEQGNWDSSVFPPPEDAREHLGRWLRARWRGLAAPLPFFPESSYEFAKSIVGSGDAGGGALARARERARDAWVGGWFRRGEELDLYYSLACDGDEPLAGAFEDLALELLVPLVEAQS